MDMTTSSSARSATTWGAEALVLVAATIVVAAAGAPLGLLWSALSGRVPLVMTADGAMYDPETETFADADGRFTLVMAGAGFVAAVLCWLVLRRYRGPVVLAVLAVGGFASALLAAWVGSRVGLDDYRYVLGHADVGWRFVIPLKLGARGAYAVQPLAGVLFFTVFAGCSRFPTLRPFRPRRAAEPPVPPLVDPVRLSLAAARPEVPAEPAPPDTAVPLPADTTVPLPALPEPDATLPGVTWPQPAPEQHRPHPGDEQPGGRTADPHGRPAEPGVPRAAGTDGPAVPSASPEPGNGRPADPPAPADWPDAPDRYPE
jgi:hypothetical protein